jgi:hypothetical protein
MTDSAESNPLTMVKPRSTWVITPKTSPLNPIEPLDQAYTHPWSTRGQRHGQTPLNRWCRRMSSGTFAAFSKTHLNTSTFPSTASGGCHRWPPARPLPPATPCSKRPTNRPLVPLARSSTLPRPHSGEPRPEFHRNRRCTVPRDHIAKEKIFPRASLQKYISNSVAVLLILVNCVENCRKIRKIQN